MQLLLVLAERDLHGYGLMKEIERQSNGKVRLEVGSLYRVIKRLLGTGLVDGRGTPSKDVDPRRRRHYRITELGRSVVAAEAERLADVVATARNRALADGGRRA